MAEAESIKKEGGEQKVGELGYFEKREIFTKFFIKIKTQEAEKESKKLTPDELVKAEEKAQELFNSFNINTRLGLNEEIFKLLEEFVNPLSTHSFTPEEKESIEKVERKINKIEESPRAAAEANSPNENKNAA